MKRLALIAALVMFGAACTQDAAKSREESPAPRFEQVSSDPVAHGERLSSVLGCSGCHGGDLVGRDWSDPAYGVLWTSNLTQSAAAYHEADLSMMIVEGRKADRALQEMPSFLFTQLHPDDLAAVIAYLKSKPATGDVHPEPTIGPALSAEIASGDYKNSREQVLEQGEQLLPDLGKSKALGRYIIRATCTECHGMDLRGGNEPMSEDGMPPPGLRMVASYDRDDFESFMSTGKAAGDRELEVMSGLARNRYSFMTETELEAVRGYLVELARRGP